MAFWRRILQRDSGEALAVCTALDIGTEFAKALVFEIGDDGHGTVRGVGPQAPGPVPHAVGHGRRHRRGRRQLRGRPPGGRGDGRLPAVAGRHRHRRRAREGLHDDPQPGAQAPRPADHRGRAPEAHRPRPARGAARGGAVDHLGDRPAERRRAARPRRDRRRVDRRLRAHEPGRVPGPPREDRDLQRVRPARPPRGAPERRLAARPRAARGRRRAVRGRPGPRVASRSASPARCSSTSAAARPTWRSSARAGSRAPGCSRWAAGRSRRASPTGSTCRSRGPSRSRSTTPGASPSSSATRSPRIVSEDVEVWAAGVELVMEELVGGDLLPGRIYLCGGGSRLPEIRAALAAERFWKRLSFARPPEVIVMAPDQVEIDLGRDRPARRPAGRDADRASRSRRSSSRRPRTRSTPPSAACFAR